MLRTVWAEVRQGKIEPLEEVDFTEGARVLVTLLDDDDRSFWLHASQDSLATVWDNTENDICTKLSEE